MSEQVSARNQELIHTTGTLYIVRPDDALRRGMTKRKKAADEAAVIAVPCVLRILRNRDKPTIELEIEDEAVVKLAAALLRMTAR